MLAAEIGGFILVHVSQQMFVRQDTEFYALPPEHVQKLSDVRCCHLHRIVAYRLQIACVLMQTRLSF